MIALALQLDEPAGFELLALRAAAAAALEAAARRGVDGEREEVLRLDEIGDEAAADEEVD